MTIEPLLPLPGATPVGFKSPSKGKVLIAPAVIGTVGGVTLRLGSWTSTAVAADPFVPTGPLGQQRRPGPTRDRTRDAVLTASASVETDAAIIGSGAAEHGRRRMKGGYRY